MRAADMGLFAAVMVEMDGTDHAKDRRVAHWLTDNVGLQRARNISLAQSMLFLRRGTREVRVSQPRLSLGRIAQAFQKFSPTWEQLVSALEEAVGSQSEPQRGRVST